MNYFVEGYEDFHNEEEQMLRQDRSLEVKINWTPALDDEGNLIMNEKSKTPRRDYMFNGRLKTCRIGNYLVSLEWCSCMDFAQRHKPCKHMYKLASRCGVFSWQDELTQPLIADFSKGYADDWKFIVRPCNYEALNIKQGIKTQGKLYNFQCGYTFYDTQKAYEGQWRDSLRKIELCLQIDTATPSNALSYVKYEGARYERHNQLIYGLVEFTVYKPNEARTRLEKYQSYECRQDEFVALLKTGTFADINGELIELLR